MASAWGAAWGVLWGNAWGDATAAASAPAPAPSVGIGGGARFYHPRSHDLYPRSDDSTRAARARAAQFIREQNNAAVHAVVLLAATGAFA